jgi:hypothetical protein
MAAVCCAGVAVSAMSIWRGAEPTNAYVMLNIEVSRF